MNNSMMAHEARDNLNDPRERVKELESLLEQAHKTIGTLGLEMVAKDKRIAELDNQCSALSLDILMMERGNKK